MVSDTPAQTATFHDSNEIDKMAVASTADSTVGGAFGNQDQIADFLRRPIQIFTKTFTPGLVHVSTKIYPWDLYMQDASVERKLANFNNLRATMKIKVVINGTPSHVGRYILSYLYLNRSPGSNLRIVSQRPHINIDPATSTGGELCLPYLWYDRAFNLKRMYADNRWDEVGELDLSEYMTLTQLSAGADDIAITLYAMLDDVQLGVPTHYVAQAGIRRVDENKKKDLKVSTVASAVADGANMMGELPVIGPFAKATSIVAKGIGGIASLFGFSRPTQLDAISPVRQVPMGDVSTCIGKELVGKLSLDPKQELALDSRVVGLDGTDELALQFLARKWSFLHSFQFAPTDSVGDNLMAMNIHPCACDSAGAVVSTNHIEYRPSILAYVSRLFEFWSGDIEVKFEFVMSAYHRGRVAIHFDPNDSRAVVTPLSNVNYTDYIDVNANSADLSAGRSVIFNVGFKQDTNYLRVPTVPTRAFTTGFYDQETTNGVLRMDVATELAVTDGVTPVTVLVYIRAGENFRLRAPVSIEDTSFVPYDDPAAFNAQSGELKQESHVAGTDEDVSADLTMSRSEDVSADDQLDLVISGEAVVSLRQLLKRYNINVMCPPTTAQIAGMPAGGLYTIGHILMGSLPCPRGFYAGSPWVTGNGNRYIYGYTTMISYLEHMYAGWRGSRRFKVTYMGSGNGFMMAQRHVGDAGFSISTNGHVALDTDATTLKLRNLMLFPITNGGSGHVITARSNLNALEFETPYYGPHRFTRCGYNWAESQSGIHEKPNNSCTDIFVANNGSDATSVLTTVYCGTGEDFNFFGFISAPVFYVYIFIPGA